MAPLGSAPDALADLRIVAQVGQMGNRLDHLTGRVAPSDPLDAHLHPLTRALDIDDHARHDLVDNLLAIRRRGGRRSPQGENIRCQPADRGPLLRR